MKFVN